MNRGILFFNAGNRHGIHLIVCLASLRKMWRGHVAIATEEAGPGRNVAEWCNADDALGPIQIITDKRLQAGGHGKAYHSKTLLPQVSPFDVTLFVDADTLFVGDFRDAFPRPGGEVTLTQFSDWVTTGGKMRQRIKGWQEVEPDRAARMLAKPWPALNTGVVGWTKDSTAFAADWTETGARRVSFMGDELAAQLIYPDHPHRILDWRFNASAVFDINRPDFRDARIVHGHGFKFWKRLNAWQWYKRHYFECLEQNRANIQALRPMDKILRFLPADDAAHIHRYLATDAVATNIVE
jgi:hypothetical protein